MYAGLLGMREDVRSQTLTVRSRPALTSHPRPVPIAVPIPIPVPVPMPVPVLVSAVMEPVPMPVVVAVGGVGVGVGGGGGGGGPRPRGGMHQSRVVTEVVCATGRRSRRPRWPILRSQLVFFKRGVNYVSVFWGEGAHR